MSHGISLSPKASQALAGPAADVADYQVLEFGSLAELRSAAAACGGDDDGSDVFSTPAWFGNLAQHGLGSECLPVWLLVQDRRTGLSFCLPLMMQPSGVALWGREIAALSTYYSSLFSPTGAPAAITPAACRAALRHLRSSRPAIGVINLRPLDPEGAFHRCMQAALRAEGWWVDSYFCFGNWHLQVGERDWAAYSQNIPSRLRNTIRRGRKKLDEAGAWTLTVETAAGPTLEQALSDFDAIYRKSWKVPEPFPAFVPGLCRVAAAQGWLRLGVIRLAGQPIAAQIWLIRDGRALIYKLAYDEEYKRFSAGSVLTESMMRRAIVDEAVHEVDYLTGDDDYKRDWMSHRRERHGLVAFHPFSLQGLASSLRHYAGRAWQRWRADRSAGTAPAPQAGH